MNLIYIFNNALITYLLTDKLINYHFISQNDKSKIVKKQINNSSTPKSNIKSSFGKDILINKKIPYKYSNQDEIFIACVTCGLF